MRVMPWPETSVVKQRHEFVLRALEDGRLPLDNNISERALRREAVGRKNWLFVGSDDGARVVARDLPHELGERREVEALDPRVAGEDDDRRGPPLILPLDDDDGRERDTRSRLLDPAVERAPCAGGPRARRRDLRDSARGGGRGRSRSPLCESCR